MINTLSKQDVLMQLMEEQSLILKEISNQREKGLYFDPVKDSLLDTKVNMTPTLSSKLNYLVHLPRKISRRALENHLNKEDLRYLYGILSECTGNGEIKNITKYQLIKLIRVKYGIDNCSISTLYSVHDKLVVLGFISMQNNNLYIADYKASFEQGGLGSFTLPSFIFTYTFKNLSITAYRLMMLWMDLIGVINYKREDIYFKITNETLAILRRRCSEEVMTAFDELRAFFDITEKINEKDLTPYFKISLKKQYIIQENELKGEKQAVHIKHERSCNYIIKYLSSHGFTELLLKRSVHSANKSNFEDLEVRDAIKTIVKQLCTYSQSQIHKVLSILKNGLLSIRSIGAFLTQLIKIYIDNISYGELELQQLQKLFDKLFDVGMSLEAIQNDYPDMYQKYRMLIRECSTV